MNKGIEMDTGDIIGILNSNEAFYNKKVIQKIAELHVQNPVDASVGNIVQCNGQGKQFRKYSSKFWKPQKPKFGFMPPHHPVTFLKQEKVLRIIRNPYDSLCSANEYYNRSTNLICNNINQFLTSKKGLRTYKIHFYYALKNQGLTITYKDLIRDSQKNFSKILNFL